VSDMNTVEVADDDCLHLDFRRRSGGIDGKGILHPLPHFGTYTK